MARSGSQPLTEESFLTAFSSDDQHEDPLFILFKKEQVKSKNILKLVTHNEVFKKFPIENGMPASRERLPAFKNPNDPFPIWKIIKNFIGKNLAKVALPVDICIPMSLMQINVEWTQWADFFTRAAREPDPYRRLLYCFTPIFMGYTNMVMRNKKPFNPILGETYELQTDKFRLVCEQITHHPPACSYCIEGPDYQAVGTCSVNPACKLTGIEMIFDFYTRMTLHTTGEVFTYKFPSVSFHNVIWGGRMYLWLHGNLECINLKTGEKAFVTFAPRNEDSRRNYEANGAVVDANGRTKIKLLCRWNEGVLA